MKINPFTHLLVLYSIAIMSTGSLYGQKLKIQDDPKYGNDSESRLECAGNLSTMSEFAKIKVYDYALAPWRSCFLNCPEASKNIYIQGEKILDFKIEKAENEEEKQAYIDTLMLLYDQRVKYFGQEGKVSGKKGIDLLKYRKEAIEDAYALLKKSIELDKTKADASVAATFLTCGSALFKVGKIEADQIIGDYVLATEALGGMRQNLKTKKATESVEKTFAESGAADCDALIKIFSPQYEEDTQNVDLLTKITELLKQTGCQESDLFAKASESLFGINPSAQAGANLAMVFASRKQYEKAIEYYNKAIELETETEKKAKYYYQLAAIAMEKKDYTLVRKHCYKAINLNPDYGEAYMLVGNAYAAGSQSCGSTKFEKATAFLAAVDKFHKAKSVTPNLTEDANRLIAKYSTYFPNNEDAFFEGYTDGKSYKIKCWINETTTIRTVKNK